MLKFFHEPESKSLWSHFVAEPEPLQSVSKELRIARIRQSEATAIFNSEPPNLRMFLGLEVSERTPPCSDQIH